jgi:hypothetical protein
VVLLQPGDPPDLWGENAVPILLPAKTSLPLSPQQRTEIAAQFQPKLELYRLRKLAGEIADPVLQQLPDSDLARILAPCLPADDPEVLQSLIPLLESREQQARERQLLNERVIVVEVLWVPAHKWLKLTATQIAKRVNALLRKRDDPRRYNAYEMGWLLRNLGLRTKRGIFTSSPEIRQRIHQLAVECNLEVPSIDGCPECAKQIETKIVM